MLEGKVSAISRRLNINDATVSMVLYLYLTDCLQEALLDGHSNTIFGTLKLNEKSRPVIEVDKEGLISLLGKTDVKIVQKIAEFGPNAKIFEGLNGNSSGM